MTGRASAAPVRPSGIGSYFATDHDVAPVHLDLPAEVTGGQHPAVAIVDQVVRGSGIVGRVTGDAGAVAVRLRPADGPVRVTVDVSLDDIATRWWADRVKPPRTRGERPRLVLVRSQGRLRGALVLARRQGWLGAAPGKGTLTYDLTPDELADGLLVVELATAADLPAWAADRLSGRDAIGLRVDRIDVRAAAGPVPATPSAGGGFAVAPAGAGVVRLPAEPAQPAPPPPRSPGNRWTRQKPSRAAFKLLRAGRRAGYRAAGVASVRTGGGGRPYTLDLETGEAPAVTGVDGREVRLGPATGPVLVG